MFKDIMYHYKSLKNYIHHKQKDIEIKSFLIDDKGCIANNSIFTRDAMTVKQPNIGLIRRQCIP